MTSGEGTYHPVWIPEALAATLGGIAGMVAGGEVYKHASGNAGLLYEQLNGQIDSHLSEAGRFRQEARVLLHAARIDRENQILIPASERSLTVHLKQEAVNEHLNSAAYCPAC